MTDRPIIFSRDPVKKRTSDRAIREMIIMNAAWAVDMARACEGKDPLPSA